MHYISGDIEGASGFRRGSERARNEAVLREHIRATAEGLRAGGEEDVLVKTFHGLPPGLPGWMTPVRDVPPGEFDLPGLGRDCAGLVMIGFHGLGPEFAHGHAYRWPHLFLNGRKVGEITVQITLAATRGVPTVMLAGDEGAVDEAGAAAPGALTVVTRPGRELDEGETSPAVLEEIRSRAEEAASRRGGIPLPGLPETYHLEAPMASEPAADLACRLPYPVTRRGEIVGRESRDFSEIYGFLLDLFDVCTRARNAEAGE